MVEPCPRARRHTAASLAQFYPEATLASALRAMRHRRCGVPAQRAGRWRRIGRGPGGDWVPLLGPGVY